MNKSVRDFKKKELQKSQELVVGENHPEKTNLKRKKKVLDVEVKEFVTMFKWREYSVVEQMKKAPT